MAEITAHHGIFRNTKLHVDDTGGPGRPVVLIHGWPLHGESWSEQVSPLQQAGYRPITYDRRGFGRSDKPGRGYDYDTLTEDLHELLTALEVDDVTLVGFSMGGGEVARYCAKYGTERLHSVVFAAAVPPFLAHTSDNPDGPLTQEQSEEWVKAITQDAGAFYDTFITNFFTAGETLTGSDAERQEARTMCDLADERAVLGCMEAFGTTDFREDLAKVAVPALVLHGDADGIVPIEGSGKLTQRAIDGSQLHVISGGPHAINVSHAEEFNQTLLAFLAS